MSDIALNFSVLDLIFLAVLLGSPGFGLGGVLGLALGWRKGRPVLGASLGAAIGLALWLGGWFAFR